MSVLSEYQAPPSHRRTYLSILLVHCQSRSPVYLRHILSMSSIAQSKQTIWYFAKIYNEQNESYLRIFLSQRSQYQEPSS